MKRLLVLFFFLTIGCVVMGQTNKSKELIVGRWDLVETIKDTTHAFDPLLDLSTDDPTTVDISDTTDDKVSFFFTSNGEFQELRHGTQYRSTYRFISNEIIILGVSTFQILQITNSRLKVQLYEEDDLLQVAEPDILIFEKSDKPFRLIKEYEDHLSHYENGVKKEEGTYHNGLEHGTWQAWHPNGQLKSKRAFINGIPTGIWKTWDETGKLIKEVKKGP